MSPEILISILFRRLRTAELCEAFFNPYNSAKTVYPEQGVVVDLLLIRLV
jgi:hypothetical protein